MKTGLLEERLNLGPKEFIASLTNVEKALLYERWRVYDGNWTRMINDLESRKERRPYVQCLVMRIKEDLPVIRNLILYETKKKVNLLHFEEDLKKADVLIA